MRIVARVVAGCAIVVALYVAAGTLGALVPVNRAWREPADGVTIWVEDNGIHVGIVMPKQAAGVDWRGVFPASDLADPRYGGWRHIAVGWGDRGFYVGTPTWWDVRPATILRAGVGSEDTVLHVEHVPPPRAGRRVRAIRLRADEYRRLAAAIMAARVSGSPVRGYGAGDAFYPARGRYDAFHTCNAWTGAKLARAGVRTGWWTPFAGGVMRWR